MPDIAVAECPVCLLPDCRGHAAHAAARPVCACERPMPLEDGNCLKCGRPPRERAHG